MLYTNRNARRAIRRLKESDRQWYYRDDERNILKGGMFNWVQWVGVKKSKL